MVEVVRTNFAAIFSDFANFLWQFRAPIVALSSALFSNLRHALQMAFLSRKMLQISSKSA